MIKNKIFKVLTVIWIAVSVLSAQTEFLNNMDFSQNLTLGVPSAGTLDEIDVGAGYTLFMKGFTFNMDAGKAYKFSCQYGGTDINIALLKNNLQNNEDDFIIGESGDSELQFTYSCPKSGPVSVLLLSEADMHAFEYTITVEEDEEFAGKISELVLGAQEINIFPFSEVSQLTQSSKMSNAFGKDKYFAVYKIALDNQAVDILLGSDEYEQLDTYLYILDENGIVVNTYDDIGNYKRFIIDGSPYCSDVHTVFKGTGIYYILISTYSETETGIYAMEVKETENPKHYTEISYSDANSFGTFSFVENWDGKVKTGAGYAFNARAGKTYKITTTYTCTEEEEYYYSFETVIGLYVLKNNLAGDFTDVLYSKSNDIYDDSELKITNYYKADADGMLKILLIDDYLSNGLNYTISVEEINDAVNYTEINYSAENASGIFIPVEDWNGKIKTGAGYGFDAAAGGKYKITVTYMNTDDDDFDTKVGLYVLKNDLTGSSEDVLYSSSDWAYDVTEEIVFYYEAETGGRLKILLTDDMYSYNLGYNITIEESDLISITEFLDNTARTIAYSDNMAYTDHGITQSVVLGGSNPEFGNTDNRYYYAEAYKITLSAGDNIKIHSAKEYDSYLYVYKANGSGGYELADKNDDSDYDFGESYINLTAETGGDYYIVVTDYDYDYKGHYYLTVWNTDEEPNNGYEGPTPIIDVQKSDKKPLFKSNIVSDKMEIMLEGKVSFIVFDMTGNVAANGNGKTWDLRNSTGRFVANGTYLVIVEAENINGEVCQYSAKLGVKR